MFVLIAFTFFNCEKDYDLKETVVSSEPDNSVQEVNFQIKEVTLDELRQNSELKISLDKIEKTFDYNRKEVKGNTSKISSTDNSFVILTDEILLATTNTTEAYTFRIETPTYPESTFENFIIEKKNDGDYQFFIYRYKTVYFDDGTDFPFIISIELVNGDLINQDSFQDYLNSRMEMFDGCLYLVNELGEPTGDPIWCFGSSGSGGSSSSAFGNSDSWIYYPDGNGSCSKVRRVWENGDYSLWHDIGGIPNGYYTYEIISGVPCPDNMQYDNGDNTENTTSNNNDSEGGDDHFLGEDEVSGGTSGGSGTSNPSPDDNTSTVAVLPFVQYDVQIFNCLGTYILANGDTSVQAWLDNAERDITGEFIVDPDVKAVANYLDDNCSPEALEFALLAIEALDNDGIDDGEVNFEEQMIFDNSWDNFPCQKNVIKESYNVSSAITDSISSVFSSNRINLYHKVDDWTNVWLQFAETEQELGISSVTTYDTQFIQNSTDLLIASTSQHESFHALLNYLVLSGNITVNNPDPDINTLVEAFLLALQQNSGTNDPTHQYMSTIINQFTVSLKAFGESQGYTISDEYYKNLAWIGLTDSGAFNSIYGSDATNKRIEISAITLTEYNNYPEAKGNQCQN